LLTFVRFCSVNTESNIRPVEYSFFDLAFAGVQHRHAATLIPWKNCPLIHQDGGVLALPETFSAAGMGRGEKRKTRRALTWRAVFSATV